VTLSLAETDTAPHPATVEVTMPATASPRPARLLGWLKRPGQAIAAEEALCRIYYEGQEAEIASPADGVLRMLAVGAGHATPTGATLALIDVGAPEA
jgi:pyruvate/2-oxoglutarate dehydrogenase complex dihydrolipoamide acyltransferase (E2) component